MNTELVKRFRKVSAVVFILGMATAVYAYYVTRDPKPKATGFTLYSTMTYTPAGTSEPQIIGSRVRYQKANGSFKQVLTYLNADGTVRKTTTLFGEAGRGVFELGAADRVLTFLSPLRAEIPAVSEGELRRTHEHHSIREELVLGHQTIVARIPNDGDESSYTELYHSADLQGFQIKTVLVSKAGTTTLEPTKVQMGEPSDSDVRMPSFPVSYDRFEMKIKALEESGQVGTAEAMRKQLEEAKRQ